MHIFLKQKVVISAIIVGLAGLAACSKAPAPVAAPAQNAAPVAPAAKTAEQMSPAERKERIEQIRARMEERRAEMANKPPAEIGQGWVNQFDTNKDGKASKEEYLTRMKTISDKIQGDKAAYLQRAEQFFTDADADKNGFVTAEEAGIKLKPRMTGVVPSAANKAPAAKPTK